LWPVCERCCFGGAWAGAWGEKGGKGGVWGGGGGGGGLEQPGEAFDAADFGRGQPKRVVGLSANIARCDNFLTLHFPVGMECFGSPSCTEFSVLERIFVSLSLG